MALSRMNGIGDRVVVDRTGLEGHYDFEFTFVRAPVTQLGGDGQSLPPLLDEPAVSSALQNQLGLKLISTTAPVEFLTVEHVEKPSEN